MYLGQRSRTSHRAIRLPERVGGAVHEARLLAPLLIGAALFLAAPIRGPLILHDEGLVLYGAERVLDGDVPYRDFWSHYSPGQFYLLAALFKLFGVSVFVERLADTVIRLGLALVVYWVARQLVPARHAVIPALLVALWLGAYGFYGYAVFPALLFGLLSGAALLRHIATSAINPLALAGAGTGLAAIFRHDIGVYILASNLAVLLAFSIYRERAEPAPSPGRTRAIVRSLAPFLGGVAAAVAPLALFLGAHVPPNALWSQIVVFPTTTLQRVHRLPLPSPLPDPRSLTSLHGLSHWLDFYAPLVILGLIAAAIIRWWPQGDARRRPVRSWGTVLLMLYSLAFFGQAISRFDTIHALPVMIPVAVLLARALADLPTRWLRLPGIALVVAALVLLSVPYLYRPATIYVATVRHASPLHCWSSLERSGCVSVADDQARAVTYLRANTGPDERIFVGNPRHDRINFNDVATYFLAGRHSATRYHILHAGVATTRAVQAEIVAALERDHVTYIVLYAGYESFREPNASALSSGVHDLDRYIERHYRLVGHVGEYQILRRTGP